MKRPTSKAKRIVCPYCHTGQTSFVLLQLNTTCIKCRKKFEVNEITFIHAYPPVTFKGSA